VPAAPALPPTTAAVGTAGTFGRRVTIALAPEVVIDRGAVARHLAPRVAFVEGWPSAAGAGADIAVVAASGGPAAVLTALQEHPGAQIVAFDPRAEVPPPEIVAALGAGADRFVQGRAAADIAAHLNALARRIEPPAADRPRPSPGRRR